MSVPLSLHTHDSTYTCETCHDMISRILSTLIGVSYVGFIFSSDGGEAALYVFAYILVPLGCIWFSESIGEYTGIMGQGPAITATTPGWLVAIGGWILLLLPLVFAIVMYLREDH